MRRKRHTVLSRAEEKTTPQAVPEPGRTAPPSSSPVWFGRAPAGQAAREAAHLGLGNHATIASLARAGVEVTAPTDAVEQEATRVSDEVARQPAETPVSVTPVGPASSPSGPLPRVISAGLAGGAPVSRSVRDRVEPALGADLSQVRVHTGPAAASAAASVDARAFTLGTDVVLGKGESPSDLSLMAHEATHVVQQAPLALLREELDEGGSDGTGLGDLVGGIGGEIAEGLGVGGADGTGLGDLVGGIGAEIAEGLGLGGPAGHLEDAVGGIGAEIAAGLGLPAGKGQQPAAPTTSPGTSPAGSPAGGQRMIRYGSVGPDVIRAQERLNAHGAMPPLATDGIFGPLTRQATLDYQRSHGLDVDAIIGPRTWASLEGPTTIGGASGSGGGGAGGPGSKVMMYDTGTQTFSPPANGTTMATIRTEIKAKQDATDADGKPKPELGPTVDVKGVNVGTPEEIYVWNVLLQRAQRDLWGGEIDAVAEIGPAAGGPAPVGQISIKIDGAGNATAALLNRGPVAVPSGLTDEKAAITQLKADFGFKEVENGTATWTLPELNKSHAALSRLSTAERKALNGVKLVRDRTLANADGDPLDGLFKHEMSVTAGSDTTPSEATRAESLHLADSAFANDTIGFIGDSADAAVASFGTIVHEAGHAVEGKAQRDAQFARMEAQAVVNNDTFALNAQQQTTNAAITGLSTATSAFGPVLAGYPAADRKTATAYVAAVNAASTAIAAYARGNKVDKFPDQAKAAGDKVAARDAEAAKLPTGHRASSDLAAVVSAQDRLHSAARDRATAFTKLEAAKEALAERKKDEAKVTKDGKSSRLAAFVAFVTKNKIPPLTAYAKQNWPGKPEEFYAEAFSLWHNDPTYLKNNAPKLKDWFDAGGHLA